LETYIFITDCTQPAWRDFFVLIWLNLSRRAASLDITDLRLTSKKPVLPETLWFRGGQKSQPFGWLASKEREIVIVRRGFQKDRETRRWGRL
jgi:hypothetical protein